MYRYEDYTYRVRYDVDNKHWVGSCDQFSDLICVDIISSLSAFIGIQKMVEKWLEENADQAPDPTWVRFPHTIIK